MIPKEVYARWSPMWAANTHPERPWWTRSYPSGEGLVYIEPRWQRCDGLAGPGLLIPDPLLSAELARIDRERPLQLPSIMTGQIWTWQGMGGKWGEAQVAYIDGGGQWHYSTGHLNLPSDSILVYGPSIYGANVPWMAP